MSQRSVLPAGFRVLLGGALTKLFAAQQAAGRALHDAVRELADAREECPDTPTTTNTRTTSRTPTTVDTPSTPNTPNCPGSPVTPMQQVTVHKQTNVHPTSVYLWNGGRWVAYSDGISG